MSKGTLRRRVALCVAVVIAIAVPVAGSGSAFGDQISGKRAEAARVADQVEQLQGKAEIVAEQFNDARLRLAQLDTQASAAKKRLAKAQTTLAQRRREASGYAVSAYMRGRTGADPSILLTSGNGSELGQRKGYASVAAGQNADAVDRLRAAGSAAESDTTRLAAAQAKVAKAKAEVEAKQAEANKAVAAANTVLDKVNGELRTLVAAEQRRRAAAAAAAAKDAARKLAAQQAAYAAANPTAPSAGRPQASGGDTGGGGAPSSGSGSGSAPPAASNAPVADVAPVGQGADAAIAAARSVLGVRYTWGGASPSTGFDCSGLVMWAWQHGGKSLPHSSRAMYSSSRRIPLSEMQPGDLVFYGSPIHHVALYIGGGQIIHSPHTGSYVQVASVSYWKDVVGAGRV